VSIWRRHALPALGRRDTRAEAGDELAGFGEGETALDGELEQRRCCPFLRFRIDAEPGEAKWWLTVTSSPGTKEVLRTGWK